MASRCTPIADRFWAKVDKRGPDECWPWLASTSRQGYGILDRRGAHRVSYELAFGSIPATIDGRRAVVRHKCDNPPCVNPAHLELGTQRENMLDMVARGRANVPHAQRPHCAKGHEYTPENTFSSLEFREGRPVRKRRCRTCDRDRRRERMARSRCTKTDTRRT